jgi:hypothetical protein
MNTDNNNTNNNNTNNINKNELIEMFKYVCENRQYPPYNERLYSLIELSSISEKTFNNLSEEDNNELKNLIGIKNNWKYKPVYGSIGFYEISYYNNDNISIIINIYKDDRINNENKYEVMSPSLYIRYS